MAIERIYYALQNIVYQTSTGAWQTIGGGQSAGITSNVNIETFSSFGSLETITEINDADFEITIERLMTSTNGSILGFAARDNNAPGQVLGFNDWDLDKAVRIGLVFQIPATSYTGTTTVQTLFMDGIISSYSMNMGLEGGLTESMTFQNAGNAMVTGGTVLPGGQTSISQLVVASDVRNVLTRKSFRKCALNRFENNVHTPLNVGNLTSLSCGFEASNEKLTIMGRSLPAAKYITYPVECSMEIEQHVDPRDTLFYSPVSVSQYINGEPAGLNNTFYSPQFWLGNPGLVNADGSTSVNSYVHSWQMGGARMTSVNQSGGDVGGGNVTLQTGFTAYNSLNYNYDQSVNLTSITTPPPSYAYDPGGVADSAHNDPANIKSTPSPSGSYITNADTFYNQDPPGPILRD